MDDIKVKLMYEKKPAGVRFTVLYADASIDIDTTDPQTGNGAFCLLIEDAKRPGWFWHAPHARLPVYARAIAAFNRRKNVCPVDAESGMLY